MNQEHPQPSAVEYENGDPDSWAETPASSKSVEMEYEGDHVKRNELGFGEFRDDTFKHKDSDQWNGSGKYDNQRLAAVQRKAAFVERLARTLLRTADEKLLEEQMIDLMALPAQSVIASLKRLDQISPNALTRDQKYRRALACCKLSQNVLPDGVDADTIQRMASVFMSIDDPTLKEILKISAQARIAQADCEDDKKEVQAQEVKEPEEVTSTEHQTDDDGNMSASDVSMLDQMLADEACVPVPTMVAPVPPVPAPELTELFQSPMPPVPMAAPVAAGNDEEPDAVQTQMASSGFAISLDDDEDDDSGRTAGDNQDLSDLFADNPEVQAQREIVAAERAQSGYGGKPVARTASTGARKLGQMRAAPVPTDELSNLWDRP
jgi:hypothetical protein